MVQIITGSDMLYGQEYLLPFKCQDDIYLCNIKGDVTDQETLKAIINGYQIDTSESICPQTGELRILDVKML